MKTLAVFLVVCLVGAFADTQTTKLSYLRDYCIEVSGVIKIIIDIIGEDGSVGRDRKFDCFAACLLNKIKLMKDDGSVDLDVTRDKAATINADPEKVRKVIDKCKDQTGKDTCEKGGNILACIIETKELNLLK